jgi:hypothetical protein
MLALVGLSAAKAAAAAIEFDYYFGFDQSVKPWAAASNQEKCVTEQTLQLGPVLPPGEKPQPGSYAQLSRDCAGTVWMQTSLKTASNSVRIQFLAKDIENCAACVPMVYAGYAAPQNPGQFRADFRGLSKEWGYYGFDLTVPPDQSDGIVPKDSVVVAIGFTNLDAGDGASLGKQAIAIDNLHVTMLDKAVGVGLIGPAIP